MTAGEAMKTNCMAAWQLTLVAVKREQDFGVTKNEWLTTKQESQNQYHFKQQL